MSTKSNTYSRAFWVSNTVEMFERMAYYAIFIVITLYLSNTLGFNDFEASMISGVFSGALYLLPLFTGAYADKIGFRKSLILAFTLLSLGYLGLGVLPTFLQSCGLVEYGEHTQFSGLPDSSLRWLIVPIMVILVVGGAFIKSTISASVAKETTSENRARAYSIFYMTVNIGSFTGKSMREVGRGLVRVFSNGRLVALILIVTGFWIVQQQLYATMPKYVIRMAGEAARPGWIANVNPFVVVVCVGFVTRLMAKRSAITSITIGMFLIPLSALLMACGNLFESELIAGISNVTLMMIVGIVCQGLAECFISPRYLEYFSLQAPKGEEGLYLGFSHLDSFLSSILGFGISGILLTKYCPDPALFSSHEAWQAASANAHYIWYYFAAIGMVSALLLLLFAYLTRERAQKN